MKFALVTLALVSALSFAADKFDYSGFGKEIELKTDSAGKLAFGVVFSLGASDPDGSNWMPQMTRKGVFPAGTSWNVYRKDSDGYVFTNWKAAVAGDSFQARLKDGDAQKILPHQAELILVFKLPSGELTHLKIGQLCEEKSESYFKNLTDKKRCFEVTEGDVKEAAAVSSGNRPKPTH